MNNYVSNTQILVLIFLIFFAVIGWIIFISFKNTKVLDKTKVLTNMKLENFDLDLTQVLFADYDKRQKHTKIFFYVFITLLSLITTLVIVANTNTKQWLGLSVPGSDSFLILIIIISSLSIGLLLAYWITKPSRFNVQKALKLSKGHSLVLKCTPTNLHIPSLMLCNPSFWRAVESVKWEVVIPLEEIDSLTVLPAQGSEFGQYKLILKPTADAKLLELSYGRIGKAPVLNFGIHIQRQYLKKQEQELLSCLNYYLQDRLILRDQPAK